MLSDMILAAHAGGEVVKKYFGETLEVEQKSLATDLRTKADTESEQAILAILLEKFTDYNIFSEETGTIDRGSELTFIVDPLDGTNNFVLGIPNFSVSIGLVRGDECIAGVIHAPLLDQTYSAEKGGGTFCNGQKISVSKETSLEKSSVSYTCGYVNTPAFELELLSRLRAANVKRYLTNWSPAFDYCLLSSGKIEAVINNDNDLYDYIAGKIIAREAGALITDFTGAPQNDKQTSQFLSTNTPEIQNKLVSMLGT